MAITGVVKFDTFPTDGLAVRAQRVYVREKWQDDWTHVPYLYCDECTWAVAPQISTAVLKWRFGEGIQPSRASQQWYSRITDGDVRNRWYVLVTYETHQLERGIGNPLGLVEIPTVPWPPLAALATPLAWVGTLEQDNTTLHGSLRDPGFFADALRRTGLQQLVCYGMEQTLAMCPLDKSYWHDHLNRLQTADRPFVFNAPDAVGKLLGNYDKAAGHKRFIRSPVNEVRPVPDDREWSTRKIVKYLAENFRPKSSSGQQVMALTVDDENLLPDNDRPVIDPTGQSLWECLCNLIARQRLLGFYVRYNPPNVFLGGAGSISIQPYTLVDNNQDSGEITVPENPNQFRVDFDLDSDIQNAGIKYSSLKEIDQLILRGARRTSTASLSDLDGTLQPGWNIGTTAPDKQDYDAGGSLQAGYAALGTTEQQTLNAEVRASDSLHAVYRFFVHPDGYFDGGNPPAGWDQKVGDGEGNAAKKPLFPKDPQFFPNDAYPVWPRELFVLPGVLLLEGLDYRDLGSPNDPTPPTLIDNRPRTRPAPLVFFQVPARHRVEYDGSLVEVKDRYWIEASKIGESSDRESSDDSQNQRWSCTVEVPDQSYGVLVNVEGQPQHVIAKTDFVPLPVDKIVGDFDWREMIVTCSFADDRYCEGRWPRDADVLTKMIDKFLVGLLNPVAAVRAAITGFANATHVRKHVIYVGDEYRQDWLCPNTVVGVNAKTGALIRNTDGGWIRNDSFDLTKRAQQIFQYFGKRRRALTFSTARVNKVLERGFYITAVGGINSQLAIGSVITQIRLTSGEGTDPPRMTYETSFLELEAIQP